MNIDSTTFSKIIGRSAPSQDIIAPGLGNAALPAAASTDGQSFHELLKQVKAQAPVSLNTAMLPASSGQSDPFSLNTATLPEPTPPGPGDSSFSLNTASLPAPSSTGRGDSSNFLNKATLPETSTPLPPKSPSVSLNKATLPSASTPRPGESPIDFLNRQKLTDPAVDEAETRHQQIEKAAEGLVSNALILPMLKQLRHSSLGENTIFSGGNGEKTFGPEFDMELSDRIAKSPRLGVKNALVARLEGKKATSKNSSTPRIDVNA